MPMDALPLSACCVKLSTSSAMQVSVLIDFEPSELSVKSESRPSFRLVSWRLIRVSSSLAKRLLSIFSRL
jgi:hypothetical protein